MRFPKYENMNNYTAAQWRASNKRMRWIMVILGCCTLLAGYTMQNTFGMCNGAGIIGWGLSAPLHSTLYDLSTTMNDDYTRLLERLLAHERIENIFPSESDTNTKKPNQ